MQTLIAVVRPFLLIVGQRAGPDILPNSRFLLGILVLANLATSYVILTVLDTAATRSVVMPLIDIAMQYLLFFLVLRGLGLDERLTQSLTAVYGADIILSFISLPLALAPQTDPPTLTVPVLASFVVLIWSLGVKGHILHRAAGLPYFVGVLIAVGLFIGIIFIDSTLFGTPA